MDWRMWLLALSGSIVELGLHDFSRVNSTAAIGQTAGIVIRWVIGTFLLAKLVGRFVKDDKKGPAGMTPPLTLALIFLTAVFGVIAYQADQERSGLYLDQETLGLKFGCSEEYPIPASKDGDKPACYRGTACNFFGHPSCTGLSLDPAWVAAWGKLQARRDSLEIRQIAFAAGAFLLGYIVLGWHVHSLVLALMLRFLLLKWALLAALAMDVVTMNAVGAVRAIAGLLKLPSREPEGTKAPA